MPSKSHLKILKVCGRVAAVNVSDPPRCIFRAWEQTTCTLFVFDGPQILRCSFLRGAKYPLTMPSRTKTENPYLRTIGGHLLLLLRKFVNISVDLMTRGPPFGITRAYEAGEEGVRCTISSMDQRKLKGNKSRGCSGVVPVATKFRHPFHSQPLFNPRVTAHVQMALRGRRG